MPPKTPVGLIVLFILQLGCAVFFIFDAITDWLGLENSPGLRGLDSFELLVSLALLAGVVVTAHHLRDILRRQTALQQQITVAQGAFADVLSTQFEAWSLSAVERDVAMMALKGLSVSEMAAIRGSKEGTIKAQDASLYKKAGVTGRLQLMSLFLDELLAEPLVRQ